jgi:hypothetical protein
MPRSDESRRHQLLWVFLVLAGIVGIASSNINFGHGYVVDVLVALLFLYLIVMFGGGLRYVLRIRAGRAESRIGAWTRFSTLYPDQLARFSDHSSRGGTLLPPRPIQGLLTLSTECLRWEPVARYKKRGVRGFIIPWGNIVRLGTEIRREKVPVSLTKVYVTLKDGNTTELFVAEPDDLDARMANLLSPNKRPYGQ